MKKKAKFRTRVLALAALSFLIWPLYSGQESDAYVKKRKRMVAEQLADRDITDRQVLEAMAQVPRHLFVSPAYHGQAYEDYPLPIDEGQTISQPYIVALMTQCLNLRSGEKVLEIGTGSGYQLSLIHI